MQVTINTILRSAIRIIAHLLVLVAMPVSLPAQREHAFQIQGHVGEHVPPATIYLIYRANGIRHTDSAQLHNGNFAFKGKVVFPTHASLILNREGKGLVWPYDERMFFIDTGYITVTGGDSAASAAVTGTSINADYTYFLQELDHITADSPHNDPADRVGSPYGKAIQRMVGQRPDSWVSLRELSSLAYNVESNEEILQTEALYRKLSERLQTDSTGQQVLATLQQKRRLFPGMPAPGFTLPDSTGRPISLAAYKGKIVLIHFWASWCKPCRAENPQLRDLYEAYHDRGVEVVSVSIDRDRARWTKAIRDDRLDWVELSDLRPSNAAIESYRIQSVPTTFLLDRNGRIVAKDLKLDELRATLDRLLGNCRW